MVVAFLVWLVVVVLAVILLLALWVVDNNDNDDKIGCRTVMAVVSLAGIILVGVSSLTTTTTPR